MKRVDAGDFGDMAGELFRQAEEDAGGAFADSKVTPSGVERVVAEIIWRHKGRANPISLEMLCRSTGKNQREVKGIVEQLVVTHRMKIGARRQEPSGYFVIVDLEDLETAVGAYRDQIFAMWRRLRVLLAPRALREMHGQLVIGDEDGN